MKRVAPHYMRDFKCIAGDCRHSCCIGWEIDIDAETLARYRQVKGAFGERLANNIAFDGETANFCLDKEERCPFLNQKGLCDIYTELGENALCQICTDHPRFYNEIAGRQEAGVGLCCEAAAKLVLCQEEPLFLETLEDDGEEEYYDEFEDEILSLRKELFSSLYGDKLTGEGVEADLQKVDWCALFCDLERLDPKWSDELAKWKNAPCGVWEAALPRFERELRNLAAYFLYRHLPGAQDETDLQARVQFAFLSCRVVRILCALREDCTREDFLDIARMYSAEIEYSEENTDRILSALENCL